MRKVQPDHIMRVITGNAYFSDSTLYVNGVRYNDTETSLVKMPTNWPSGTNFTYEGIGDRDYPASTSVNMRFFRFDQGKTCEATKRSELVTWKAQFSEAGFGSFDAFCIDSGLPNIRRYSEGPLSDTVVAKHPAGWVELKPNSQPVILDTAGCLHSVSSSSLNPNDGVNAYNRDDSVILYETDNSIFTFTQSRSSAMVPAGTVYNLVEISKDFTRRVSQHVHGGNRYLSPIGVVGDVFICYEQSQAFGTNSSSTSYNDGSTSYDFRFKPLFFSFTTKQWYKADDTFDVRFSQWGPRANSPNSVSSSIFTRTMPVIRSYVDNGEFIDLYLTDLVYGTNTNSHLITEVNLYRFRYNKADHTVVRTPIPTYDGLELAYLEPDFSEPEDVIPVYEESSDLFVYSTNPEATNVKFTTNYFENLVVPNMGDNDIDGFTATASSSSSTSYTPHRLFSHSYSREWRSEGSNQTTLHWVQIEFDTPTEISREMTIVTALVNRCPKFINVVASVDGEDWIEIVPETFMDNAANYEFSLRVSDDIEMVPFKFIRFNMPERHSTSSSDYTSLQSIRLYKPGTPGILLRDGTDFYQPTTYGFRPIDTSEGLTFPTDEPLYLDFTASNTHGYVASSSGSATGYPPERAFMEAGTWISNSNSTRYLQIDLKEPTILRKYSVVNRKDGLTINEIAAIRTWTVEGFDGSAWRTIHIQNTVEGTEFAARGLERVYEIPNNTPFYMYRLNVGSSYGGNFHAISKWNLYGIVDNAWIDAEKMALLTNLEIVSRKAYKAQIETRNAPKEVFTGTPTIFSEETVYPLNGDVSNSLLNNTTSIAGASYFAISRLIHGENSLSVQLTVIPTGYLDNTHVTFRGNTVQYLFDLKNDEIHPNVVDGIASAETLDHWAETLCKDVSVGMYGEANQNMHSFIDAQDRTFIISTDGIYTASFNNETCKYELTGFKIEVNATALFLSANNDLWFTDIDYKLYKMRLGNADTIKLEFSEDIEFTGEPASSILKVSTYDDKGNFRSRRIYVNLTGPVEFSNGTKGMVITTSNDGVIEAPVIVTGYGSLFASARPTQ